MDSTPPTDSIIEELYGLRIASSDLPTLLHTTLEAARHLVPAARAEAILVDPDSGDLLIRSIADGTRVREVAIRVEEIPMRHVLATRESQRLSPGDSNGHRTVSHELLVPLISRETPIGLLRLTRHHTDEPFVDEDEITLRELSGYAASAIENAYLYERSSEINRQLKLLVESSNAVSSSLDLGAVLNAITRHMMRALDADWCIVSDWDPSAQSLHRLAENRSVYYPAGHYVDPDAANNPLRRWALNEGRIYNISASEDEHNVDAVDLLNESGCQRILGVPLQVEGKVVGLVEIGSMHTRVPFPPGKVNRSMRTALNLAAQMLRSPDDMLGILKEAARDSLGTTGADWCAIYTWDEQTETMTRLLDYGYGSWQEEEDAPIQDISGMPTLLVVLEEHRIAELSCTDPGLHPQEHHLFVGGGLGSMLALPLVFKDNAVGLVQLYGLMTDRVFTPRELGMAYALARQAAIALENARLVRDLQRSLERERAMQAQLVRTARLSVLGELSAMLAHQISNPLTIVLGDAEMLMEDLPAGEQQDSAAAILRAGKRAKQVVERVLKAARHEDKPRLIDVRQTIEETLELVEPQIARRGIRLDLEIEEGLPPVHGVAGQLEDIWSNLLINARDAVLSTEKPQRWVSLITELREDGSAIVVTVSDNGTGIPQEKIDEVFNPLYTTKPHGQGTGLGLYVVRQIVDTMHGTIDIKSTVDVGTSIIVSLPVHQAEDNI